MAGWAPQCCGPCGIELIGRTNRLLYRQFRPALPMLDGDAAGQSAIEAIAQQLGPVGYESRCDPFKAGRAAGPTGSERNQRYAVRAHATRRR